MCNACTTEQQRSNTRPCGHLGRCATQPTPARAQVDCGAAPCRLPTPPPLATASSTVSGCSRPSRTRARLSAAAGAWRWAARPELDSVSFVVQSESQVNARMKTRWFKRFGWFYVPVSVPGMVVVLLAALFCLTVFRAVDRHSHSASDTLYGVFPFFVCTFLLLDWIGSRTSRQTVSDRAAQFD